jgi:general secretion pathway protein M
MADLATFRLEMRRQAEDLASRMMASDVGQRLLAFYDQLGERDRLALRLLGLFGGVLCLYLMLIAPLAEHGNRAARRLDDERALLAWLRSHEAEAGNAPGGATAARSEPLATLVNKTADENGVSIRRYEPAGEDGVRLWLEGASFNAVVKWLFLLEGSHGIRAEEFSIERESSPGLVSVRLTLRG